MKIEIEVNNADDVVEAFKQKGFMKGEPEKVVRLLETSTVGQVNMKPVKITDENLHKSFESFLDD